MKMKDHFALPVVAKDEYVFDDGNIELRVTFALDEKTERDTAKAAAHAINCHDELVKALMAFAAMADAFDDAIYPTPNQDHDILYSRETMGGAFRLTIGDLRRARDILKKAKGE